MDKMEVCAKNEIEMIQEELDHSLKIRSSQNGYPSTLQIIRSIEKTNNYLHNSRSDKNLSTFYSYQIKVTLKYIQIRILFKLFLNYLWIFSHIFTIICITFSSNCVNNQVIHHILWRVILNVFFFAEIQGIQLIYSSNLVMFVLIVAWILIHYI
ncbi:unnamed protein product [Paramecium octaurelia]|uniref:Uncharacterized protein n=1 Tax=Paramecium octaurelia TaxID=43137 RepID=A0A8S1XB28_PAROT|nr:unnamed protein product [Paramecium octaurelia]